MDTGKTNNQVGIVGLWYRHNYGSILAGYALSELVREAGFNPLMVNKPRDLWDEKYESRHSVAGRFIYKHCKVAPVCVGKEDYQKLNDSCGTFVTGADAVWDYELCGSSGQYFFLDFVSDDKKRIAYAAGFGAGYTMSKKEAFTAAQYLKKFEAVSVREKKAVAWCKQYFDVRADTVLNPVLVCDPAIFIKAAEDSTLRETKPFITSVIQGAEEAKQTFLHGATMMAGLPLKNFVNADTPEQAKKNPKAPPVDSIEIEDLLYCILNGDLIITDSYQSMCMAIAFHKPFIALTASKQPDRYRFVELLKKLGLEDRLLDVDGLSNYTNLQLAEIDYDAVDELLKPEQEKSRSWLETALKQKKQASFGGGGDITEVDKLAYFVDMPSHAEPKPLIRPMEYKIQDLVLPTTAYLEEHWWMMYRGTKMIFDKEKSCRILPKLKFVEFFTYFNAISIKKWKQYTKSTRFKLHLTIQGQFNISFFGHFMHGSRIEKENFSLSFFNFKKAQEIILPISCEQSSVASFSIESVTACEIYGGYYTAECTEKDLNPVELAIVTTTFKKEDYVARNMEMIQKNIIDGKKELGSHLFVNVIDNGRTLDADEFGYDWMKIFPNPNVGGAGGFTRGMIETMRAKTAPTHVLLMDDDVMILPESLNRTYTLLRLLKDEYKDHVISGAMLNYEDMYIQHEDIGVVRENGTLSPLKPSYALNLWDNVLRNEQDTFFAKNAYTAWWYCCMPADVIRPDNLPLPIFIRGDDMEFGLRNKRELITLNGICIMHMSFTGRCNPTMDKYMALRNCLITQAVSGICDGVDYLNFIKEDFNREIRRFNYPVASLILDAIEDFLNGPDILERPEGERIVKDHAKKQEQMSPLSEFAYLSPDFNELNDNPPLPRWKRLIYRFTYNGHLMPKFIQKKNFRIVSADWVDRPTKQFLHVNLLAVNLHNHTGVIRTMSKKKFAALFSRYTKLLGRYNRTHKAAEKLYRERFGHFTSLDFWKGYLGID
jgi:GT2 family glycosyltransferase